MAVIKVGGDVDALCTRCKLTLGHTILAMMGTKIARVRCNTCKGEHTYRTETGPSSASKSGTRATSRSSSTSKADAKPAALPFEEVLASKDVAQARNYSVKDTYKQEDLIRHPTFGLGVVTQTRPDKVDVTFKMYVKTLIHGRGETPAAKPAFAPPKAATEGPADKPVPEES